MRKGCRVRPLSKHEIRLLAGIFRHMLKESSLGAFLEWLIAYGWLQVLADNDPKFLYAEALYSPAERCIFLREFDYIHCVDGTNPRSLFTFAHELGHMALGHDKSLSREINANMEHELYEDSEWQANTFAAEFLMPLEEIKQLNLRTPDALMKAFGVSREAAQYRLQNIKSLI